MPSVHEQNLRNAERAIENFHANMASDMPQDEVLLMLSVHCEAVDLEAYSSYASEPVGTYPEVEEPHYSNFMLKMIIARGRMRDYFDGKISADEALAYISRHLTSHLDRRAGGDPAQRDDEGVARPEPSPPSPKGAVPPADELIRGYKQQFQKSMNFANFLLEIGKVEDPEGVEALENLRRACDRMIAFLEERAAMCEGLAGEEARLELAMVSVKVMVESAYVGTMLSVATRHMPKEDRGRTGPTRAGAREPQGPRPAPAGHAPADQAPRPSHPLPPRQQSPRQQSPRRPSPRYAPPPSPPFGMSPDAWHDFKVACGCILLFAVAGVLFFGCLIGVASG